MVKYRGVKFRGGNHDFVIARGGIQVFPRLVAAEHRQLTTRATLGTDIPELDALLGGGIEEGMSTLIVGAAGTGTAAVVTVDAAAIGFTPATESFISILAPAPISANKGLSE